MMRLEGPAQRLTIFVGETDLYHHKSLASEIARRARRAGLAGASVFHGVEGYGASNRIHTTRILSLTEDLPVAIVIIDTHQRIAEFLPQLDALISKDWSSSTTSTWSNTSAAATRTPPAASNDPPFSRPSARTATWSSTTIPRR
jgi:PII-like signaling protein